MITHCGGAVKAALSDETNLSRAGRFRSLSIW